MLKYLIVQLDDSATSFCHYSNYDAAKKLMPLDILKKAVIWSMQENLMVQFVMPDYPLPQEYLDVIDSIDYVCISNEGKDSDVTVFNGITGLNTLKRELYNHVVLRISKYELFNYTEDIKLVLKLQPSVNIVLTDIERLTDDDFKQYQKVLESFVPVIEERILAMVKANVNLLTDRLSLNIMNNCGAGSESITIMPNGSFYICPGFYYNGDDSVGILSEGIKIPNEQLYKLEYAPICRKCDAFQCKRCIWLNKKMTLEVNTPSHQQCVLSHLERNASRELLSKLKASGKVKTNMSIPEIDYLDPFETIIKK